MTVRAEIARSKGLAAVQSVIEIIQALARQRGRDAEPLLLLRQIDGLPGERISHLPAETELTQAWLAMTGEPFRPHQAQALMTLRRGEPVALRASTSLITQSALLLVYVMLLENSTSALLIVSDQAAVNAVATTLKQINAHLPQLLRRSVIAVGPHMRAYRGERIVIATADAVHSRLLRHHDRAWGAFWARVCLVTLLDVHRYAGVAAAHLTDMIFRFQRIAAAHNPTRSLALLATVIEVADPQPTLSALLGQPWRIIAGDDMPADATTLGVWRGSKERLSEASWLAREVQRHGFHIHIRCQPLDTLVLKQAIGETENITFGAENAVAHVLVVAGAPNTQSDLRQMLRSGYQAVVIVLGDSMREQMLARHTETLLNDPPTIWPEPPSNAYVSVQHILCAATELPLTASEVEAWGVQALVDRLVNDNKLVDLPDPEVAWKPTAITGEPYAEFSLLSASGPAIVGYDEQMQMVGQLDPTSFERWAFPGAALPPGAWSARVTGRDEGSASVTLQAESNGRRTHPLRRCEVAVRDEQEHRSINGRRFGLGRVLADEEVYGCREANAAGVVADLALKPSLKAHWGAPACWFDFNVDLQQSAGQMVGWSLIAALPLRVLASFTDAVPCYDHAARRLYIVDAQPGGNGVASWLYAHAEHVLPLAYDIALACRGDALFEPCSRVDMDWLLTLLGQPATIDTARPAALVAAGETRRAAEKETGKSEHVQRTSEVRRRAEFVAGPPPAPPRSVPPAVPDERRPTDERIEPVPVVPDDRQPPAPPIVAQAPPLPQVVPVQRPIEPPRRVEPPARLPAPAIEPPRRVEPPARPPAPASEPPRRVEPPARPPAPTPPVEETPDPSSMIKRLQRQRQQREAEQSRREPPPSTATPPRRAAPPIEARFNAGEHVFCLPYGNGIVTKSVVAENGRELLTVEFPTHGELQIDPAVSMVRKVEPHADEEDDLL